MGRKILFIAKLCCAERDLNESISKYYNVTTCSPDIEIIASVLTNSSFDAILIYLPEEEVLKFVYYKDVIDYAQQSKIPIIMVGSGEELKRISKESLDQIDEILYKPISTEEILNVLKNYIEVETAEVAIEANQKSWDTRKRLLLIDDTAVMLRSLKAILSDEYQVCMANSALNALKCIGREKPDAILLDYEMPVYDGKQTLKMLRQKEETKDIPVFFMTAVADREKIKEVIALKPEGYLLKPPDKKLILKILNDFFRRQRLEKEAQELKERTKAELKEDKERTQG